VIERRTAVSALEAQSSNFAHARQGVRAVRTVTNKKTGEVINGARLYVSSIPTDERSPRQMARLVRGHWTVENNIHWLRDAVGRGDTCRQRNTNAACALALLRTALLAPVHAAGHGSLTLFHESCAKNRSKAVNLIAYQRLA
jgi:predicted transposase YbfD/YdcC